MPKIIIAIIVVSIVIVLAMWLPNWLEKYQKKEIPTKPIIMKSAGSESTRGLLSRLLPPKPLEKKNDWKVIITWIIGSANGILLILSQIQRIFGAKNG